MQCWFCLMPMGSVKWQRNNCGFNCKNTSVNNIQNISSDESDRSTEPEYISTLKSSNDFKLNLGYITCIRSRHWHCIPKMDQKKLWKLLEQVVEGESSLVTLQIRCVFHCSQRKTAGRLVRMPSECNQGKVSDKTVTSFLNVAVSNI